MDNSPPVIDSESKTHSRRYFFDSSGIFALIDSGYLQRFCDLIPNFCITPQIHTELTKKETLVKKIMSESISTGKIQ